MHLILTGATGLVGSGVLQTMLTMESVTKISILSRRPVPMVEGYEDKAKVYIHTDYSTYPPSLLEELKDAHGCVWAQGNSAMKVSKPYVPCSTPPLPTPHSHSPHPLSPSTQIQLGRAMLILWCT